MQPYILLDWHASTVYNLGLYGCMWQFQSMQIIKPSDRAAIVYGIDADGTI